LLKRNLIANYAGQGWSALSTFIFVPVYIHYLGLEAYGLIGFFAMLQAWFTLLDAGLGPALGREMARFTGGQHTPESIRDLLKSVETISIGVAFLLVLCLWFGSDWIANNWLVSQELAVNTIKNAIALMGFVAASRVLEGVYRSALLGLQKQVVFNFILIGTSTLKSVGAVGVIALIEPSIEAFFVWQAIASVITVWALAVTCKRVLPTSQRSPRFSWKELGEVWVYAKGMLFITILSLMLMQIDKLVLSRVLSLTDFGVYSLAATVAMALLVLITPISQAWFPRLSQLHAQAQELEMISVFHIGAQLVTVILGSAAVILFLFAERVLVLWTQNTELAEQVAPLLKVLILGNLLHGFMWIPYQAQLAHGWTSLSVKINVMAVSVFTPTTIWIASNYGAFEVCLIWLALNVVYATVGGKLMFNKIMKGHFLSWIIDDLAKPLLAAFLIATLIKNVASPGLGFMEEILLIGLTSLLTLTVALFAAPMTRTILLKRLFSGRV